MTDRRIKLDPRGNFSGASGLKTPQTSRTMRPVSPSGCGPLEMSALRERETETDKQTKTGRQTDNKQCACCVLCVCCVVLFGSFHVVFVNVV